MDAAVGRALRGCSPSGQRGGSQRPFPRRASVGPPSAVPSLLWLPPAPPCKPLTAPRYQKAPSAARAAGGQTSGGARDEDQMRTKTGPRRPQIVIRLCGNRHIDEEPCIQSYFREIAIATMVFLVEPHLLLCPHPSHSSCLVPGQTFISLLTLTPALATKQERQPPGHHDDLSSLKVAPFAAGFLPPGRVPCRTLIHLFNKSDCAGLHALHSNIGARQRGSEQGVHLGMDPSASITGQYWSPLVFKAPDSP